MKILVSTYKATDAGHPHFFRDAHLRQIRRAAGAAARIVVTSDQQTAMREAGDADIIAGFPSTIPALGQTKKLRWLHSFSAGVDRIVTPDISRRPVLISNSSGIHATPIAEHIIGFMLIFTRGFYRTFRAQAQVAWKRDNAISELRGKTVLIAGLGDIGAETARLAHPFGCRVIAVSRTKKAKPAYVDKLKTGRGLDSILPKADFVVICLPHTKDTHHLFGMKKFRRMKKSAVLINIGRGGIVNEKDLITALRKKIIGGAALDVFEKEPLPPESPLWRMENVVITPHHSGLSEKYMDRAVERFCLNLTAFRRGMRLPNLVDKKRGY